MGGLGGGGGLLHLANQTFQIPLCYSRCQERACVEGAQSVGKGDHSVCVNENEGKQRREG